MKTTLKLTKYIKAKFKFADTFVAENVAIHFFN